MGQSLLLLLASETTPDATATDTMGQTLLLLGIAVALILLNGFFVAAEFALVKVRLSRVEQLLRDKRPFARTAKWLATRLDESLSACQLGITMASLALGWVGEPAFAMIMDPVLMWIGLEDEGPRRVLSFIVAFSFVTALHLVIGEQFPKIYSIREPEKMLLWCAAPMKFFYVLLYPFLTILNGVTSFLLRLVGVDTSSEHEGPSSEEEIRALLREAHIHGNVSRAEHSLINNVFEFDDLVVRRVMVPRGEVDFFDINDSLDDLMDLVRRTKHTRYPVCNRSLDKVLGVIHIKDLLVEPQKASDFDIRSILRPPKKLPETMPISRVLRHFQATHQLIAFVIDEYGTITGMVTLENVLEKIVGAVDDEFDVAVPDIVPAGQGEFIVCGTTPIEDLEKRLGLSLSGYPDVDTVSGMLMEQKQGILCQGDRIELDGAVAEVLEVKNDSATKLRFRTGEMAESKETKDQSGLEVARSDANPST